MVASMAAAEIPVWSDDVLDLFASIPVQESGRIKPLDTVARFYLLRLNGKRSLRVEKDGKSQSRSSLEWFLDCLFYPEVTDTYRCFSVDSYEAVTAAGIEAHGKKRDRYSYHELQPGLDRLMSLAQKAAELPPETQTFVDTQIITLAGNVLAYESLTHFLDFAKIRYETENNAILTSVFNDRETVRTSDILEKIPKHMETLIEQSHQLSDEERQPLSQGINQLFSLLDHAVLNAGLFAFLAPDEREENVWLSPADIMEQSFESTASMDGYIEGLRIFEAMTDSLTSPSAFYDTLRNLHRVLISRATARNEYKHINLEIHYYRANYLFFSQWLFLTSFLLIAITWLRKKSDGWSLLMNFSLLPPIALLAISITLRCIIRERPPVTTLYETILFSTLIAALLGFALELVSRNRISMSLGALFGLLGLFFAWRYEAREGTDTMPAVIAVLDTNFWLAIHVTTIIIGYGAGLFTAALGHVYVFLRILRLKQHRPSFFNDLGRITYGVFSFCLVFTLIGTVLGGIWAAQSWGRFWGWDPKENGALLIVLWALAILHARRGGYLRHDGIALSAIVLGMIVVFAWWGVNALGVGLHSYGFTSGIWGVLLAFWAVETAIILAGAVTMWFYRDKKRLSAP
ncbi:MAG: cytochrome c biogenesis protein CcsA [Candidatus Hydrogenedentales bacterium]